MTHADPSPSRPWWQIAVIYQIYPRSYQDSDGDGTGDLPGITARLDHLVWLGVDAIWISPFYPSPMKDFGYDIADYRDVDPLFGTLEDFDRLVVEAHALGLRVIVDFVPNHTSDQHPWFLESRSSRESPKRSWYLWADARDGGAPPTNWLAVFGGSAWEWDEVTGQYYYHAFLPEQPDLNWRHPDVRTEMYETLRFWMDRGVDGFRVDVIWHLIKDDELRDNPPNPSFRAGDRAADALLATYTTDRPEVHDVIAEMRSVVDEYPDPLLIGEIYLPVERLVTYYGSPSRRGVHLPFNFQLLGLPWDARTIAAAIDAYEGALPENGWPNWVLGNHDQARIASRVGEGQARVAAMLLLTLRGTPTLYYGDELGMTDVEIPEHLQVDPARHDGPAYARDKERTPMPWDGTPSGGFTIGTPWLPLGDDHAVRNVAAQREDPASMLSLHRALLALRRREPALSVGGWSLVATEGSVLAYERRDGSQRFVVALNLAGAPTELRLAEPLRAPVVLSTHMDRMTEVVDDVLRLRPDEGLIVGPVPLSEKGG